MSSTPSWDSERGRALLPCLLLALASCALAPREERLAGTANCSRILRQLSDPDPAIHELLQRYNFPPDPFPWRLEPSAETEHYRVFRLTFPSPRKYDLPEANTVHCEYYLPRQLKGRGPAIVVLDILDGSFRVARLVCRSFALAGTPSLLVKMPYYGERRPAGTSLYQTFVGRPERMLGAVEGTVVEVRRAASWLASRREVDPARIGLVGTSLGGIISALAAGVDPSFSRNVLILAGSDPAGILWHAPETQGVRERLERLGLDLGGLREQARAIDPLTFARRAKAGSFLMINATADDTVPRKNTLALWEALGRPAIHWYPAGHYTIALFIPAILPSAIQFVHSQPRSR